MNENKIQAELMKTKYATKSTAARREKIQSAIRTKARKKRPCTTYSLTYPPRTPHSPHPPPRPASSSPPPSHAQSSHAPSSYPRDSQSFYPYSSHRPQVSDSAHTHRPCRNTPLSSRRARVRSAAGNLLAARMTGPSRWCRSSGIYLLR